MPRESKAKAYKDSEPASLRSDYSTCGKLENNGFTSFSY